LPNRSLKESMSFWLYALLHDEEDEASDVVAVRAVSSVSMKITVAMYADRHGVVQTIAEIDEAAVVPDDRPTNATSVSSHSRARDANGISSACHDDTDEMGSMAVACGGCCFNAKAIARCSV
jgi:hypothetical protein